MSESSVDDTLNKNEENQDTGAKRAGERVKSEASKKTKKVLKKAKEQSKYAKGGISKIAYYVLGILIIIIMVVGFVFFIINVPGSIQGKMARKFAEIVGLDGDYKEEEYRKQKTELLDYINKMGFDPVGMGFATIVTYENGEDQSTEKTINFYDDTISIETNSTIINKSLKVLDWLMYANERVYQSKETKGINKLTTAIFGSDSTEKTGTGLLNIYGNDLKLGDGYQIDRENLKLTFYNANGFFKTDIFQYDMDGWAGRYGTPLELLLSLHASTMMPDLVTEFVSNPNLQTIVNIEAKEVELDLNVRLTRNAVDGNTEEVIINVGSINDETLGTNTFEVDENGNVSCNYVYTYEEEGTEKQLDLKEALYQKKISLFNIYNTFKNFNYTYNDFKLAEGDDARLQRIQNFLSINDDNEYMYIIPNIDGKSGTTELINNVTSYLGDENDFKIGESKVVLNNNGVKITVTINEDNTMTYNITNSNESYSDTISVLKIAKIAKFYEFVKTNKQVIEGYDNFSDIDGINWYRYIDYSGTVRQLVDEYLISIANSNAVIKNKINYSNNKYYNTMLSYTGPKSLEKLKENTTEYNTLKEEAKRQIQEASLGHENREPSEQEIYGYYLNKDSQNFVATLDDMEKNVEIVKKYKKGATELENYIADNLGMTVEQIAEICELMSENQTKIKTYVPTIQSVIKHWYKDIIFNYKNMNKGTVFTTEYTGNNETGVKLYYQFTTKDNNYPTQDGEPYIIKGDSVTQNGKEVSSVSDISIDEGTEALLTDYDLGDGYKLARKLFTQGYYYQYDGSTDTANEITLAKKIEAYSELQNKIGNNILIRVTIMRNKIQNVTLAEEGKVAGMIETIEETGAKNYYIYPPKVYVSPISEEGLADLNKTEESVKDINECLKNLGTDLRRKKVNVTYSTTALTALSMLEGMHTLDGEYTYREFKEFLIELGYYSRAELEAVETDVLDWFMPGFTPDNWPPIKSDKEILEYGTTILSSSNVVASGKLSIDKINNIDNFGFFQDKQGIISYTHLAEAGNNVKIHTESNLTATYIVNKIKEENLSAVCIYLSNGTDGDINASVDKTKKLINDIRAKLKDNEEKGTIPIYMFQALPIEKPGLLDGNSADVERNQNISNYNINLFAICSGQDNVKCIDATSGCVDSEGWLENFDNAKFTENIINKIVKNNASNGGFEEGVTVITPGAGYITSISENEITIEFSLEQDPGLKPIDGFTMVISGLAVDAELQSKFASEATEDEEGNVKLAIEKGTTIGLTTTENVKLILRDRNKAIINNIEDYMPITSRFNIPIELEQTIQVVWGFEGTSGGDGSGYYTVVNPGNGDSLTVGHGVTNAVSGSFEELGYGGYVPFEAGDKIPVEVVDAVSVKELENKINIFKQKAEDDGITLLDQEVAALTIFSYQNPAAANHAYSLIVDGKYNELRDYWLNANETTVEGPEKESVEYGITLRRCVEWNIFETGNMEFSHERKYECYKEYKEFIKD